MVLLLPLTHREWEKTDYCTLGIDILTLSRKLTQSGVCCQLNCGRLTWLWLFCHNSHLNRGSSKLENENVFNNSTLELTLNDSMKTLSVGLTGDKKVVSNLWTRINPKTCVYWHPETWPCLKADQPWAVLNAHCVIQNFYIGQVTDVIGMNNVKLPWHIMACLALGNRRLYVVPSGRLFLRHCSLATISISFDANQWGYETRHKLFQYWLLVLIVPAIFFQN